VLAVQADNDILFLSQAVSQTEESAAAFALAGTPYTSNPNRFKIFSWISPSRLSLAGMTMQVLR
jgi:hypothetical protein